MSGAKYMIAVVSIVHELVPFNSKLHANMKLSFRPIQPSAMALALLAANALLAVSTPGTKPQRVVQSSQTEKLISLEPPASNHSATDSSGARMRVVSSRPDRVMAFVAEKRTNLQHPMWSKNRDHVFIRHASEKFT
jgi:hypothetical protein